MDDLKELWNKILAEIELEVSRANYLTLFKRTQILSVENEVVTIAAPSAIVIDLLQRRFYEVIKKSTDKHVGKNSQLIFVPKTIIEALDTKKDNEKGTLFDQEKNSTPLNLGHPPRVRADYTFANMAVSSTNQLAFVSASTVAKKPGETYNPLFIYGPTGVGKTHLMQAIANEVYAKKPNGKILYTTSEEFTNEVVESIRTNNTSAMKKKFRELDLLIIDDIQFVLENQRPGEIPVQALRPARHGAHGG